jgi:hypothetical protein
MVSKLPNSLTNRRYAPWFAVDLSSPEKCAREEIARFAVCLSIHPSVCLSTALTHEVLTAIRFWRRAADAVLFDFAEEPCRLDRLFLSSCC